MDVLICILYTLMPSTDGYECMYYVSCRLIVTSVVILEFCGFSLPTITSLIIRFNAKWHYLITYLDFSFLGINTCIC